MSASDQEILAALPAVLADRVVAVDDVTAALIDGGLDMGPDPTETLQRATSMEGSFGDLVGGFVHLPTFLDGTVWSIELTAADLQAGAVTEPLGIDPLIWWMVTDQVAAVDADGQVLGLIEVDSFDGSSDSVLLPDAVVDGLDPGWVTVTIRNGVTLWATGDGPIEPSADQIAAAKVGFASALADPRNAAFTTDAGLDVPEGLERVTDTTALLEAIAADRQAFVDAAVPSATALFEAAGFETNGRDVATPGFNWDALSLWRTGNQASLMFELTGELADRYRMLMTAFTTWSSDGVEALDAAAVLAMFDGDPRVVEAFAAGPTPAFDADDAQRHREATAQLAFVDALETAVPTPVEGAVWFRASCLDRLGRPLDAAAVLDAAAPEATNRNLLQMAAELTADRGDAPAAYALLERVGALEHLAEIKGEAETHTPDLELLFEIEPFAMSRPKAETGRNDQCPCGSGKKYKKCHLGSATHTLSFRAPWVHAKAMRFARGAAPMMLEALAQRISRHVDDPAFETEMTWSPFIADLAMHEGGALGGFLDARRQVLPADEVELAESWLDTPRAVYSVEEIAGQVVQLVDVVTEQRITVGEMASGSGINPGDLMVGRPLPVGDVWRAFGGFMPCDEAMVEPLLQAIAVADAAEIASLIGGQLAPEDDDPFGGLDLAALGLDGLDLDALDDLGADD